MAKPGTMPSQAIIDGFKGVLDFYYWKRIAVARRWPRYFARQPTPAEITNQTDFAYINKLYSTLPSIITDALKNHALGTTQTAKDYLVRAYLKGLQEIIMPFLPEHDHTAVGDGGPLSAAIIDTFINFLEQAAAPPNPPANSARLYAREDAGVTKLYYKQDDGTEVQLGAPPVSVLGAEVERQAPQNIPNAIGTAVAWDTQIRDDNNFWAPGTPTRITIPATGWYSLTATLDWQNLGPGQRNADWLINAVTWFVGDIDDCTNKADSHQNINLIHYFTAADFIEVLLWHNQGGAINLDSAQLGILQMP